MAEASFTLLGSGSGMPSADRATSGYALKIGDSISIIDCGGGVCSSFVRCGLDPLNIDRVFISHTHPDHCCELPLLIQMVYLAGRKAGRREPVELYLPDEFVEPFGSYLRSVYLIIERMPFEIKLIGYKPGFQYAGDFDLTATANSHLSVYADFIERLGLPNRMQCCSFSLQAGGRKLFYSSDITSLHEIKDLCKGVDLLVLESTHIDLEGLPLFIDECGVKQVILTHLGTKEEVDSLAAGIKGVGPEKLMIGYDGLVLPM